MVPLPFMFASLVIACGMTALLALQWGTTHRGVVWIGAGLTPFVCFAATVFLLVAIEIGSGHGLRLPGPDAFSIGLLPALVALPSGVLVAEFASWIRPVMTPGKAIITVLVSVLLFAWLGSAIGFSLGTWAPNYYRDLYRDGHSSQFDPVSVGMELGMSQGAVAGVLVGMAAVAAWGWYDRQRYDKQKDRFR